MNIADMKKAITIMEEIGNITFKDFSVKNHEDYDFYREQYRIACEFLNKLGLTVFANHNRAFWQ